MVLEVSENHTLLSKLLLGCSQATNDAFDSHPKLPKRQWWENLAISLGTQDARRSEAVYSSSICWLFSCSRNTSFHFYFYSSKLGHKVQFLPLESSYCYITSFCFSWFKVMVGFGTVKWTRRHTASLIETALQRTWSGLSVIFLRPKWTLDAGSRITILTALSQLAYSYLT